MLGTDVHFYNDEDGQQSFHSFVAQYQRTKAWRIEDHGSFIHVVSQLPGRHIEIYANKFSEDEKGVSDIEAVFRERHITPSVIVHRGHSPYVDNTIAKNPARRSAGLSRQLWGVHAVGCGPQSSP